MVIASVGKEEDIRCFLLTEEIKNLHIGNLEGDLIRIHRPWQHGKIIVSINEERKTENFGMGIGESDSNVSYENVGIYKIFIGNEAFNDLKENGKVGTRYRTSGAKIDIYDISRLEGWGSFIDRLYSEALKKYKDRDWSKYPK